MCRIELSLLHAAKTLKKGYRRSLETGLPVKSSTVGVVTASSVANSRIEELLVCGFHNHRYAQKSSPSQNRANFVHAGFKVISS